MTAGLTLTPKAPWIVGRTPLLEHAAADYLNELTRQTPWLKARREELLEAFDAYLGEPAPLLAYTPVSGEAWTLTLPESEQAEAAELLADFRAYLHDWGWRPDNSLVELTE
ncbi:hypothetical protein E7T06_14615 [Deinococcus sp. Arct2-2]|uniref:hypothetical protein n=1 Tax=Deinococcus sp. Arct2-2 TaxID=2568653 RepID=UPI0010A50356|nr:hypothetical protein [Deinococcus sp. Arct2-2]THF68891.1 hypothetical protein E7T06_14615 [Deinococcus sp. Arct2-2]